MARIVLRRRMAGSWADRRWMAERQRSDCTGRRSNGIRRSKGKLAIFERAVLLGQLLDQRAQLIILTAQLFIVATGVIFCAPGLERIEPIFEFFDVSLLAFSKRTLRRTILRASFLCVAINNIYIVQVSIPRLLIACCTAYIRVCGVHRQFGVD